MITECPGAERFKQPYPEPIFCRNCGAEFEIWSDEFEVACTKCGRRVSREAGQSCLDWCASAKVCVGEEVYNRYMKVKRRKR